MCFLSTGFRLHRWCFCLSTTATNGVCIVCTSEVWQVICICILYLSQPCSICILAIEHMFSRHPGSMMWSQPSLEFLGPSSSNSVHILVCWCLLAISSGVILSDRYVFLLLLSSSSSWLLLFHFCRPCPNHCCFNCQCQSLKAWTAMRRSTDVCRPDHQAITKLPLRGDTRTPPRRALWRIPLISSSVTRGRACGEGRLGGLNILGLFGALKLEIHGLTAIPSAGEVSHPAISDDQKLHGSAVLLGFLEG